MNVLRSLFTAVDRVKNQGKNFNFIHPFSGRMWHRVARWLVSDASRQRRGSYLQRSKYPMKVILQGIFRHLKVRPSCPETSDTAQWRFETAKGLLPARVKISNEGHSPGDISTLEGQTMLSRNVGHRPVTYKIYQKNEKVGCTAVRA